MLEMLAVAFDQLGPTAAEIHLDWQHPDDPVEPGDVVPFIVIGVRPARVKPLEETSSEGKAAASQPDAGATQSSGSEPIPPDAR